MISRNRHGNQKPYEVFVHCRGYIVLDDFASIEMMETLLIKTHEVLLLMAFIAVACLLSIQAMNALDKFNEQNSDSRLLHLNRNCIT